MELTLARSWLTTVKDRLEHPMSETATISASLKTLMSRTIGALILVLPTLKQDGNGIKLTTLMMMLHHSNTWDWIWQVTLNSISKSFQNSSLTNSTRMTLPLTFHLSRRTCSQDLLSMRSLSIVQALAGVLVPLIWNLRWSTTWWTAQRPFSRISGMSKESGREHLPLSSRTVIGVKTTQKMIQKLNLTSQLLNCGQRRLTWCLLVQ